MRIRFLLLSFLMTVSIFAQDFSGRATYRTHRKSSIKLDSTTMASSPGIQEQLEAQMRKMFQKTYTLDFTKSKSVYKEVQELDAPKVPSSNGVMIMVQGSNGSNDVLYKNIAEIRMSNKKELM